MERIHIVHPFEPVYDENSRILILGSFPSVKSREQRFYYGHPRNRFWPMMGLLFGENIPDDTEGRRSFLLRNGIAVWDVIAECDITGSSDASVRNALPNDLSRIVSASPVGRILLNGQLAGKLYDRYQRENIGIEALILPSTSPANAAWSMTKLQEAWRKAIWGNKPA